MRFGVLGPMIVSDGDRSVPLGGPKQRAVLGVLLMNPGHPIPADVVVGEVWGDDAGKGVTASLHTNMSNLRGLLGKDRIVRDPSGYRLEVHDGDAVDAVAFAAEIAEARRLAGSDPAGAVALFESALSRWRGRPFEGLEDIPMLVPEITRLDELHATVEMDRFDAILRAGDTPSVGDAEALCQRRPLDERPWGLLMRTLYRSGRQADALRTYGKVKALFGREMGIEPSPALARVEEQILLHDPVLDPVLRTVPSNLPVYLTSFVGRVEEQRRLKEALVDHRLVTVTGPGGVGKTRLVVEVASAIASMFSDGVWFVDLAQLTDPTQVEAAIATSIGVTGSVGDSVESVVAALAGRRVLVILDNCEHVVDEIRSTTESMLRSASGLGVLATSRIALGSVGDFCFPLDGLTVSGEDGAPGEAETLFKERARAVRSTTRNLENANEVAVAAICRRLDGMPLALELAAARSDVRSPSEIESLLTRRFSILVDERQHREIHRSLEATIGWSYGLLMPDERMSFAALGVFEGPFTAEDAGAVLGQDHDDAVALIETLATGSLISVDHRGGRSTIYRMLETLRAYARDRLAESGRWEELARRHDHHFVGVCRELAHALLVAGRPDALARIAGMAAELDAAWDRMEGEDPSSVMPLAWALGNHWIARGGIAEGERRTNSVLDATVGQTPPLRMYVLLIGARLSNRRGDEETALAWTDEALELAQETGVLTDLIPALNFGALLRVERGDHLAAIEMLHRSIAVMERTARDGIGFDSEIGIAWALVTLAEARRWAEGASPEVRDQLYEIRRYFLEIGEAEGQLRADRVLVTMVEIPVDERLRLAEEMLDLARSGFGDGEMHIAATRSMAEVIWEMGEQDRAAVMNRAVVRSAMAYGSLIDLGSVLLQSAMFAGFTGRGDRAAKLAGAGHRLCGIRPGPYQQIDLEQAVEQARSEIGDDRFEQLYHIGAAMGPEEAAAFAVDSSHS